MTRAWIDVNEGYINAGHNRRGIDWWNDHRRYGSPVATIVSAHPAGDIIRIAYPSRPVAQRWADLMVASGVPRLALVVRGRR